MKTALAIAAHPDDIEFLMAGTLMLLADAGYEIHYLNLSDGNLGSTTTDGPTTAAIREAEARKAAASIGAVYHQSITHDLNIFYDQPTLAQVASLVRLVAPDIVLTHSPVDYMEDHMMACRLAVTAVFSRGMPNFVVDPPRPPVATSTALYHAQPYSNRDPLRRRVLPDFYVDITDKEEAKVAMLAHHQSQKQWLDESQGLDSYLNTLRQLDAEVGQLSGRFQYAEGWRRHLHLGFCAEQDDPLVEALPGRTLEAAS